MSAVAQPQLEARLSARRVQQQQQHSSISAIRRKPRSTYISPSASEVRGPLHLLTTSSTATQHGPRSSSSLPKSFAIPSSKSFSSSSKHTMGPPLPLYHPFGKLAMSLPPLDPTTFGLPVPITIDDDSSRSSSHSKRSGVKLRDAAVETDPIPPTVASGVSAMAAIAAREIKDKASPRKKRAGGGGKRKRNPADDGDATYPAKRTRQPRGAVNGNDEEPESPDASANVVGDVSSAPGTPVTEIDKPERRTTRSRGGMTRRDSTASETPSISAASVKTAKEPVLDDKPREIVVEKRRSTSKEEGEVSEESKSA
ncbi:hypothetical protein BDP27DRAFT_1322733 [Rhodocollybia butyracea]|uniref:Uncharacterized protein n=1 Tax=Rhodocollybia butyracea TaxID=206335 RepID=A0A9P5U9K1_9AGAR|nr:hypothetical protein BDP27DRAFT_1322733 [Rhodocollybia butyracea]